MMWELKYLFLSHTKGISLSTAIAGGPSSVQSLQRATHGALTSYAHRAYVVHHRLSILSMLLCLMFKRFVLFTFRIS